MAVCFFERSGAGLMNRIAAVICNYNKSEYVINCIQSVMESAFKEFDVLVVDNASSDDSVERIRRQYGDDVKLFVNRENLGGSGGFNTGIRYALEQGYEYVWCLDNDVLVDEQAIGELYQFMEQHPEVGMTGSKVYHMEAPEYVQQFGIDIIWDEYCCEAKYCNHLEDGSMPEVVYSDAVAACSVLVRTSLIRIIGPLPEENFLYWDDTEWGIRCNRAGYKVASLGSSRVLHSMGAKKETVNTFPLYYSWRNWIRFFMRYTPEEKQEDMCCVFLEGIFDIIYNDLYLGEENRMKTVMYAYDDAIHGRTGKAQDSKIYPVVHSEKKLQQLLEGKKEAVVYANDLEEQALAFAEKTRQAAKNLGLELGVELRDGHPALDTGRAGVSGTTDHDRLMVVMTDDIFRLDDLELTYIYADREERILATEEDLFLVLNRDYSRRTFLFSQKNLFLTMARAAKQPCNSLDRNGD